MSWAVPARPSDRGAWSAQIRIQRVAQAVPGADRGQEPGVATVEGVAGEGAIERAGPVVPAEDLERGLLVEAARLLEAISAVAR
jgi:hypothetical protein